MYLSGIADEAGAPIETQLRAIKELGWKNLELRNVELAGCGKNNVHNISEEAFVRLVEIVKDSGIRVNCFSSTIANWGKCITDEAEPSIQETLRAIPRMKALGTQMIRIMSYKILPQDEQYKEKRFKKLREITKPILDAGLTPVHENCMNYGGMGWPQTLELLDAVPGLQLVFDTGNPAFNPDYNAPQPWPRQNAWDFYEHVKDKIAYVHIKDAIWHEEKEEQEKCEYVWAGEGNGFVKPILEDLAKRGYNGGISIEPHMGTVFHDPNATSDADLMYSTFVEYGKRLQKLILQINPNWITA